MTPTYINVAEVGYGKEICRLKLGYQEGDAQIMVCAMMICTPSTLKRMSQLMAKQVERYEREHGPISDGSIVVPKIRPVEVN